MAVLRLEGSKRLPKISAVSALTQTAVSTARPSADSPPRPRGPLDSVDCRNNATTCIVLANQALNQREQSTLFELATSWMKQAEELESDPELSDAVKDVRTFARHH
jgi:hypothetical protein